MTNILKRALSHDAWSFYDFKSTFDDGRATWQMPSWMPDDDQRRITSYRMVDAYYRNAARFWLSEEVDDDERKERREYGDAFLIVEAIRSSLLGNDQTILVDGSVDNPEGAEARQQRLLNEWVVKERFTEKAIQLERDAVKLGDGVLVFGWDERKRRPRVRVYDPGFYFPVLNDRDGDYGDWADMDVLEDDFPAKVHIAYEFERTVGDKIHRMLRRMTWELRQATVSLQFPWNDEPTDLHCFHTDAIWDLEDDPKMTDLMDLSITGAKEVLSQDKPLNMDFIPIVHFPNTVSETDHFGTSSIAPVIQIFDDLSGTDSDAQAASATTGTPVIALSGAQGEDQQSYGPGTVFNVGDGRLDMMDTSKSLDALLKYRNDLFERLSINSRTPKTLLGAVDPSKVPSGIVLTLSFSPHSKMVDGEMRLVRKNKYSLSLKIVSRLYMLDGQLNEIFPAVYKLGSYLPADKQEAMTVVMQGLQNHAMSQETAMKVLIEAGYPIDDAAKEIERIIEEDLDAATKLLDATGDMNIVRRRLGLPEVSAGEIPGATAPGEITAPTGGTAGFPELLGGAPFVP